MEKISKSTAVLISAYDKGYRIINGEVINPSGIKIKKYLTVKPDGYRTLSFTLRYMGVSEKVRVHRLVAYQKYKNKLFKDDIQVRHLDGDSLNNLSYNIAIGTPSENMMDKEPAVRLESAISASNHIRRFSDQKMKEIKSFYDEHKSYKLTMAQFDISSKGTLWYMLNKEYSTKV